MCRRRSRARASLAALLACACVAAASTADASGSSRASARPATSVGQAATLSNLRTLSRWAYAQSPAAVRAQPSSGARVLGRLRFLTADGQAQPYLALRSFTAGSVQWDRLSIPRRPNGLAGWVRATALGTLHITHEHLRINRELLHATLFRDARVIWDAPIGVGRPSLPTPAGQFFVTEKLTALGGPFYGPFAIGTSAFAPTLTEWPGGGVIGIHGTDQPQLIPGRPSHGCVRLRNADIVRLWPLIEVGTPIEIV